MHALLVVLVIAAVTAHVPGGVTIPVALVGTLSSADVKAGAAFHFKTTADITAGSVTIPAGTPGYGTVTSAASGGRGAKSGDLALQPQALLPAGGDRIKVAIAPKNQGALHARTHAHLFPLPFLVGGALIIGGFGTGAKNATLKDGTPFEVVTEP